MTGGESGLDVYFGENFWHKPGKGADRGICIEASAEFWYGTFFWCVPAIYVCREGIVLDILRRIPKDKIRKFLDKWGMWQEREEELTGEQTEKLARENPLHFEASFKLAFENRMFKNSGGSGICILPSWAEQKAAGAFESGERPEDRLSLAYGLCREDGWQVFRHSFRYGDGMGPGEVSSGNETAESFRKRGVSAGFRLTVCAGKERMACGDPFVTEVGLGECIKRFPHPVTGEQLELKIQRCSGCQIEIPASVISRHIKGCRLPAYGCVLEYVPPKGLGPGEEFTVSDCSPGDGAVCGNVVPGEKKAASVAVIGGSHGPTSVFLAGNIREKEPAEGKAAYSSLHVQPVRQVRWQGKLERAPFEPETFILKTGASGAVAGRSRRDGGPLSREAAGGGSAPGPLGAQEALTGGGTGKERQLHIEGTEDSGGEG